MYFSNFAEFGDPSRRFCHCVAPNHVFYKGFGIAWHQTVLFTMVLAFHWTHFWCSWTKYGHFVETICAFLFLFFHPSRLFFVFFSRFTTPLVSFSFSCFLFFFKSAPPLVWPKKWIFTYSNVYFLLLFFSAGPEPDFMSSSKGSQILKTVDNSMQKYGKIDVALKKHAKNHTKTHKKLENV